MTCPTPLHTSDFRFIHEVSKSFDVSVLRVIFASKSLIFTDMKTSIILIASMVIAALALVFGLRTSKWKTNKQTKEDTIVQTDTVTIAKRVLNLIILDESGSMSGLEKASVDGVNETIQTIRSSYEQLPEQEQLLTFVTFSSYGKSFFRTKAQMVPISMVQSFSISDYTPNGTTPLYDTMGKTLTEMEKYATESDIVLVTIITDGYENSSRNYDAKKIKELVGRLDEKNWVFTYIGANQDAILEASKLGIDNAMNYSADESGTRKMWEEEKRARTNFMTGARRGESVESLKRGYFDEN